MQIVIEDSTLVAKTKELCQAILDQTEYQTAKQQVEAFLADEDAKARYQTVVEKSELLNHKQNNGVPLTPEEIADFEAYRAALLDNPVARGFLEAQEQMHKLQQTVQHYVTKTLEIGRVPSEHDFSSCGHGCGCSH
jgi:cell fate (sporulation/competence/biofilm development) regulator YlbF (YheA/YmcA/DUF963 family)